MANPAAIELHASGAETADGQGAVIDLGEGRSCVQLDLVVTAVAGTTPTMALTLQTAPTETGPWRSAGVFTTVSAAGKSSRTFAELDRYVRESRDIGGTDTPSFTYSLAGQAHQLYCQPSDIGRTVIPPAAISTIDAGVLATCCLRATGDAETALNSAYTLPITAWGEDLRGHTAARALYYSMSHRGFKPDSSIDQLIVMNGGFRTGDNVRSAAQEYFEAVASGALKPVGIVDQTPETFEASFAVESQDARDW